MLSDNYEKIGNRNKPMEKMENVRSITLMLTNSCNLNCTYCYEKHKQDKCLDLELGKRIVYEEITQDDGCDTLFIEFLGGEPFMEFETMKQLFEYIYSINTNKKVYCLTTTNGTYVHGEVQEWLFKNREYLRCGLSLDGTKNMHNLNRSNSFDNIDINFFVDTWSEQSVKMTISPSTITTMAEGIIFLHDKGLNVDCNLAYGVDWKNFEYENRLKENLSTLIEYYLQNPKIKPCSMLNVSLQKIHERKATDKMHKLCGTGSRMRVYDTDGKAYPCQYFIPSTMLDFKYPNISALTDELDKALIPKKCHTCVLYNICPNCYGANYLERGNMFENSEVNCKIARISASATAFLQYQKYVNNKLSIKDTDDEYRILRAIKLVQRFTV